MRRYIPLLVLLASNAAAQGSSGFTLYGERSSLNSDSAVTLPEAWRTVPREQGTGEWWLRWQRHGLVFDATLAVDAAEKAEPLWQGRANELYYDFAAAGLDFSVGKKVIGSGIGYGFRPLDLIQNEDRRSLAQTRLEGVPLLMVERIGAETTYSLTAYDRLNVDESGIESDASQLLLRGYRFFGDLEGEVDLHWHEQLGTGVGAGFTWVGGGSLELHGAVYAAEKLLRPHHALLDGTAVLATSDPWQQQEVRNENRSLIGMTWSNVEGYTLIVEAWHDGSAMTRSEWKKLFTLADAQRSLLGTAPDAAVYGNLAWDSAAWQGNSLLPQNLLLRLSHDGDKFDPWIDLLVTPEDGGYVATVASDYEIRQGLKLQVGLRDYGGPKHSAYGELPLSKTVYLRLSGETGW